MPRQPGRTPEPISEKRRRGAQVRSQVALVPMDPAVIVVPIQDETPGDSLVRAILEGVPGRWITAADQLALLPLLRDAWNERARLRAVLDGEPPESWVWRGQSPAGLTRLYTLERQISDWLSQLALTPADRARMGIAEVQIKSGLESLRERAAAKRASSRAPRS